MSKKEAVNAQDNEGNTALHFAVIPTQLGFRKEINVIQILLDHGMENGLEYLFVKGADPLIQNKQGKSAASIIGGLPHKFSINLQKTILAKLPNIKDKFKAEFSKGQQERIKVEREGVSLCIQYISYHRKILVNKSRELFPSQSQLLGKEEKKLLENKR